MRQVNSPLVLAAAAAVSLLPATAPRAASPAKAAPPAGTGVVTVGVSRLYGAEEGVGH